MTLKTIGKVYKGYTEVLLRKWKQEKARWERKHRSNTWYRYADQQRCVLGLKSNQALRISKGKKLACHGDKEHEKSLGSTGRSHAKPSLGGGRRTVNRTRFCPHSTDSVVEERTQPNPFHPPSSLCSTPYSWRTFWLLWFSLSPRSACREGKHCPAAVIFLTVNSPWLAFTLGPLVEMQTPIQ